MQTNAAVAGIAGDVYQDVLDSVLLARLAPGSMLDRAAFAARCRVSAKVADAALAALERMGLVTLQGQVVHIAPCEVSKVLEHLDRRRELELKIVRAATTGATDAQIADMKASEALQGRCALIGDLDGLMNAERKLEALLVSASGFHDEGEELKRIKIEFRRAWCAVNRLQTFTKVANIRTALVAAIAARDPDAAEAQVRIFFDHLVKSY